jgi:uncharacterized protein YbcV (DUF1398 family)
MFTLEKIKAAHSKVKSGADFPTYVNDLKTLGVMSYEHMVADGQIIYLGANDFKIASPAKWSVMEIATVGSKEMLQKALMIHQEGQTDYHTFCRQSAEAGVEKWVLDLVRMVCMYYDKSNGELLVERVPTV